MPLIEIDALESEDIGLSPGMSKFMAECARHCFISRNHLPGVRMYVRTDEDNTEEFEVFWKQETSKSVRSSMNDEERTTDYGAMGVSLLLATLLTRYKYFVTSCKGTGFDFWLFEEEPEELDFSQASARLEISGIRRATETNSLKRRLDIKKQQVKRSDSLALDAYISIVEFQRPESIFQWQ